MAYAHVSTLVLIDSCVEDSQILVKGVVENAKIAVLNPEQDGIFQISQILEKFRSIKNLHIISHGQPGYLQLGATGFNNQTLPGYINQIQQWKRSFTKDSSISLYGCQVAANAIGRKFVQALHDITGVTIAASTTLTGCAAKGGNWNLDVQVGEVHASSAFHPSVLAAYAHVLPTANLLYGNNGTTLKTIDTSDGSATTIGTLSFNTFAIARDAATGRVYYIENKNNGQVAYFDPATGSNVLVGTVGVNVTFYKLAQSVSGQLYGMDNTTSNLYEINQNTGSATPLGLIKVGASNLNVGSGDIAFDPTNPNRLFVSVPNGSLTVYTVDTDPNSANFLKATLVQTTGLSTTGIGSLAFGADGQLYTVSNGEFYRLDPTGGTAPAKIGTAAGAYSDFASLPVVTPTADLQVTVSDGLTSVAPNSSITYTVTVTNASTTDLTNISVSDLVPSDVTGVTWTAAVTGGGGFPTATDESGSGNPTDVRVNLNAGAKVVYTIQGTVSNTATAGSTLTNQASVSADGINDPDLSNNSATDETTVIAAASPTIAVNTLTTADRTPQLTGTVSVPTALIKVTVNGQTYDATNNGNGTWTLADNSITNALPDNTYSVTAVATDAGGTVLATDTTANELVVDGPPTVTVNFLKTDDLTPQLTGTVDDLTAKVKVMVNGQTYDATNNGNGTWTLANDSIMPALGEGTYAVVATATDTAGNSANDTTTNELVIDVAPIVTVNFLKTGDNTPQLTGTVDDPTAIVTVTINGKDYAAVNNGNGTWTLPDDTITPFLADGTYSVLASAKDSTGNIGTDSTSNELTIDTTLPQVIVTPIDTITGEDGSTGTFQVVLNRQPSADVTLSFTSSDATEGTLPITTVLFTPTNWNSPQLVTVIGVDDTDADGTVAYSIKTSVSSADSGYNGIAVTEVGMTNLDNEPPKPEPPNPEPPNPEQPLPINTPPQTADINLVLQPGAVNNLSTLSATDAETAIASYTIVTLPPTEQGVLYLGNPKQGGTLIQAGQAIAANQIKQIFFQTTEEFSKTSFTYTATDTAGAIDLTPATVVLSAEDCDCNCESGRTLDGTSRRNNLKGTPNVDRINGRNGNDVLHGWGCDDNIKGGSGRDRLFGDGGNDFIKAGLGRDRLRGGEGRDRLLGGRGQDRLHGGEGNDWLHGQKQHDRLWGRQGEDSLLGGLGHDSLRGGIDNDRLLGNRGRDRLKGESGDDWLHGGVDRDRLNGGDGNDMLRGGRGRDLLWGRQGDDTLLGGQAQDTLWGYNGDDVLIGGLKRDKLTGGKGDDVLIGGRRADRLIGGAGQDQFVYRFRGDAGDRIVDFGTADIIDISRLVAAINESQSQSWKDLVNLNQVGSHTVVQINLNSNQDDRFRPFSITLENFKANSLGQENFVV